MTTIEVEYTISSTSQPLSTQVLIGAGAQYTINKLALQLHSDNFNRVTFGLGIGF